MTNIDFLTGYKQNATYKPDILTCLANLSNDEVFTPPSLANDVIDMLPKELFYSPDTKFLDPGCKSGVFLREIARRLMKGLEEVIPNENERRNHIFTKQVFGIAITELTALMSRRSLYCSQTANGKYSVCTEFKNNDGNIKYTNKAHTFKNRNCIYCGASESEFGENSKNLEKHAYEFIHLSDKQIEEYKKMKFDVIIGNPPYQMGDAGHGTSAKPIYQLFVKRAKKLNPRYLAMIIPSRWFVGGKGLDDFRNEMLNDANIRKLVDYENYKEIFPGVDLPGGACYFLWDKENSGLCKVANVVEGKQNSVERKLNEFEVFVRQNLALDIVRKIKDKHHGKYLDSFVSSRKPFGLSTNYQPQEKGIPCWFIQRIGKKYADSSFVDDSKNLLNKWKFLAPKAPIAGQTDFTKPLSIYYESNTIIAKPGECCTESFIVLGAFNSEQEVKSFKSYLFTKTVRFLLLQAVISQDITRKNFCFVPHLENYTGEYSDKQLCDMWGITNEEWEIINFKISNGSSRQMEEGGGEDE